MTGIGIVIGLVFAGVVVLIAVAVAFSNPEE